MSEDSVELDLSNPIVTLNRQGRWYGRFRDLRIILDEIEVGRISHNKTKSFPVPTGEHELYVKMDWVKSDPIVFECIEGDHLRVDCIPPKIFSWAMLAGGIHYASRPYTLEVSHESGKASE